MTKFLSEMHTPVTQGRLEWIGIRNARRMRVVAVESAELIAGRGMAGDHIAERAGSKRQVTLIQHEYLPLIAQFANVDSIEPESLRRNLVVSGINLYALQKRQFRIGQAVLESTGNCDPCQRMEETISAGGFSAMLGHGGLTAIVHTGGRIAVGDIVVVDDVS